MLHAHPQDPDYLIDMQADAETDAEALNDAFSVNVQDHHWLVYCSLGGHEHYDLPDVDTHSGFSILTLYAQAA